MSASERQRTLLMVTYEFPPAGGPGVQRAAKFAKYLPEHGWRPVVITARPAARRPLDESLARDVTGVEVHVTAGADLSEAVARVLRPFKRRLAHGDAGEEGTAGPGGHEATLPARAPGAHADSDPSTSPSLSSRIAGWLSVPDDRMPWRWVAGSAAARLADAVGADAVFSTAPPYTAHLVGMRAARGRPFVADFRDPWTSSGHLYRPTAWHASRDAAWERRVVERADLLTCISEPIAESLAPLARRRPVVLQNGFDPAELPERRPTSGLPLRLVYTGAFYADRTPVPFLDAVAALVNERPEARDAVKVEFVGTTSGRFAGAVAGRGLSDVVTLARFRPHDESLAALASADAALLFIAPGSKSRGTYTGKLFEYLGLGVPVLAMSPPGVAADLIAEASAGWTVPPDDPDAIRAALARLVEAKERGRLVPGGGFEPDADVIARYDRRQQTRAFARLLDGLVGPRGDA